MAAPSLASGPSMDDIKIGPAGETFGELKQRVRDARERWARLGTQDALDELETAHSLLRAAYVRMGLPYVVP